MKFATPALAAWALGAVLLAAGCGSNGDAGPTGTETRTVASFDRIHVNGRTDVIVRRGSRQTLTLRGEEGVLDDVETTVSGETLTIEPHGQHDDRLEVTITLPRLRAVEAESAGDIHLVDVDSDALDLRLDGAGELTARGHVATLHAILDGAGELELAALTAERATVRVDGLGKAEVNVTGELDATVTGVGDIEYHADPIVRSDVQGLGDVSPARP